MKPQYSGHPSQKTRVRIPPGNREIEAPRIICMHALLGNWLKSKVTSIYVCMYVRLYICYQYVHMYVIMYVIMYVGMYVCMYERDYLNVFQQELTQTNAPAYVFSNNLYSWRDLNPGLLFPRRMYVAFCA
jgi:hypothetical protein